MTNKFDGYSRDCYRLSAAEIDAIIAKLSHRDMEDINFAQKQVVNSAKVELTPFLVRVSCDFSSFIQLGCKIARRQVSEHECGRFSL